VTRARNRPRAGAREPASIRVPGPKPARVPVRTCAGCGVAVSRDALRRIALVSATGGVEWRERGGRGTYLHDAEECRRRFVVGKRRLPGLRAAVSREAREALVGPVGDLPRAGGAR